MKNPGVFLTASIQYNLLAFRHDQLWLPGAIWLLVVIMFFFFQSEMYTMDVAGGYLGAVIPLIAGVLSASVVLGDPALELQLSTPRSRLAILFERLGVILATSAVTALSFQAFLAIVGVDMSTFGSFLTLQLDWLVPSLALIGLSCALGFTFGQPTPGSLISGLLWIVQLILRDWFVTSPVARYFFLFTGVRDPQSPYLAANLACLAGIAIILFLLTSYLFRKTERYL